MLAKVNGKLQELVSYLNKNFPDKENVKRLVKNYNPKKCTKHYQQVNTLHIQRIKVKISVLC